ncbi:MAG: DUF3047 domain-containing protein [Gemmatimonadales bacterium]
MPSNAEEATVMRAMVLVGLVLWATPGDLLRLEQAVIGPGALPGWQVRRVKGRLAPDVEVRAEGLDRVLRISGARRAAWFYRDLRRENVPEGSTLRWSWRVLEAPATTDLRNRAADDSPIRVYVVFGNPRALFGGSGRIIFYSYGNQEPNGYAAPSHVSGRIHVVRVDGATELGVWREHAVNPAADYRRIWGRDLPAITAIGLMQDTDQTDGRAVAELRQLSLEAPAASTAKVN